MDDIKLTYKVFEDGYDIYRENDPLYEDGHAWISQREPNIPNKELSYEENAKAQIDAYFESLNAPQEDIEELNVIDETEE